MKHPNPTKTILEALPHSYGFFSAQLQRDLAVRVGEHLGSGSSEVSAVALALSETDALRSESVSKQVARDLSGYRAALQAKDQDTLYARAAAATASVSSDGYASEQASDGTWTIYSVPIFSEHEEKTADGKVRKFDKPWLEKALATAKTRHAEGYYPPAHVRHHDLRGGRDEGVEAGGKLRFTDLQQVTLGGTPTWTVFADLVGLTPDVYDRIRKGELSYRSVEILDVTTPEIDSLAFLDHEVPFFRYPLLRVREEQPQPQRVAASASGALAFRAGGRGPDNTEATAVLFSFTEGRPMDPKHLKPVPADPTQKQGDPMMGQMMALLQALAQKMGVSAQPPQQPPQAQQQPPQAQQPPQPPPQQMGAGPVEVGLTGANLKAAQTAAEGQTTALLQAKHEGAFAAMSVELGQLRERVAKQETEARLSSAAAKLREEGFTESMVEAFAKKASESGETAALAWADGARIHRLQEPPASWAGEIHAQDPDTTEVAHYAKRGPEALERARSIASSWRKTGSELSLKEFLEIEMDPGAYIAGAGR